MVLTGPFVFALPGLAVIKLCFGALAERRTEFVGRLDDPDSLHPLISARVAEALAAAAVPVLHQWALVDWLLRVMGWVVRLVLRGHCVLTLIHVVVALFYCMLG